jgi:chromosome segregation ATPase
MPRNKGRRGEANRDWEANGTEESYVDVSGGDSSSNRVGDGGVGELGDDNDNDHINNNTNGGRPLKNRAGSSQHIQKHSLGTWTEAVSDTVRSMGAAHQAIKDLQGRFTSHLDDLRMTEETKDSLRQLQEDCMEKDEEIRMQANTITTLTSMKLKTEEKIEHQKKELERDKKELEQEKAKLEKRVAATIAEERLKLTNEVEKLAMKNSQSYDKRMKELEDEATKQGEENNRRVAALEADNKHLSTTVEQQKETIEDQAKELEKSFEQCDVLERAKDSFKRDKVARETELEEMKKEFALSPKSKEYLYVF